MHRVDDVVTMPCQLPRLAALTVTFQVRAKLLLAHLEREVTAKDQVFRA
jgi:hypothetical protein